MKLKLTVENLSLIRWWIDVSYNVHWDAKGHNGAMVTLGKGAIISNFSSTESKLVATHDQIPDVMHTLYFIKAPGYAIDKSVIYQDNQSTIILEVNGKMSLGKKTKHISSRFFFITDKIARGKFDVEYCPAEKMWCHILNKPKQGASYRLNRNHIMNVPVYYDLIRDMTMTSLFRP